MPTIGMGCIQRLGLIAAVVVACLGASTAHAETVLRIGNVGEPGSLDPQQISSTYENRVVGDMFLGLTTEAADGSMVPGAAESWTIDDDGRVYTFKLRDHKWSDGQAVTADDFVFAFRRVLEPAFAGIYASLLYPDPASGGVFEQRQLPILVQLLVAGARAAKRDARCRRRRLRNSRRPELPPHSRFFTPDSAGRSRAPSGS